MEPYACPSPGCKRIYPNLNGLFQHIEKTNESGHNPRGRWLIVDRSERKVYITDTPLGKLSLEKLRESAAPPPLAFKEPKEEEPLPA